MPLANAVPPMLSGRPSAAPCSPLDRSRSAGPQPFDDASQVRSLTWSVPAGGAAARLPARVTRNITTPWDGTVAEMAPADVETAFDHRFFRVYWDEPPRPTPAAVVATLVAAPPRLNRTTATEPSLIGLAHTSVSPESATRRPCAPPQSWLTATTSALATMDSVPAGTVRRSLPSNSGADSSDQSEKCAVYSVAVIPPLPTSSMSGSL